MSVGGMFFVNRCTKFVVSWTKTWQSQQSDSSCETFFALGQWDGVNNLSMIGNINSGEVNQKFGEFERSPICFRLLMRFARTDEKI